MKKRLSLAVTLAIAGATAAGAAGAQTLNSGIDGAPGDLFLVVYDSTSQTSYFEDLGISTTQVESASAITSATTVGAAGTVSTALPGYSNTIALDTTLSTQLSTHSTDSYSWEVVAANAQGSAGAGTPNFLLTSAAAPVPTNFNPSTGLNNTAVTGNATNLGNDIDTWSGLNVTLNGTNANSSSYGFSNADPAAPGQAADAGALTWYGSGGITATNILHPSASTSSSGQFYLASSTASAPGGLSGGTADIFNLGTVSLNAGATDTLVFASPVPLPAGVWLLASGLMGLLGVSRRRLTG
jgi:hypothetical protein